MMVVAGSPAKYSRHSDSSTSTSFPVFNQVEKPIPASCEPANT
jgi:hypothetical protein